MAVSMPAYANNDARRNAIFETQRPGFCPCFFECRVFSAGMKIVIDKNVFELYMHFMAFGVILLHFEMD
jgi:hypothetical protein